MIKYIDIIDDFYVEYESHRYHIDDFKQYLGKRFIGFYYDIKVNNSLHIYNSYPIYGNNDKNKFFLIGEKLEYANWRKTFIDNLEMDKNVIYPTKVVMFG